MHRIVRILIVMLSLVASSAFAEEFRVAIMDFTVESDNPQFKYLGKGFAELTSVEMARIPGVVLVDRAKRNAALEEQAFSLSEGADEKKALQIGKLLAVDYLVSGTIVDMMGNLIVSYQVVKTESGAIVDKRQTDGAPAEYKRMVREIGAGLSEMIGSKPVAVAKVPEAPKVEKQAEVLSNFSEAVEALDKKDVKTATSKLEAAQKIDPSDQAVKQFLDKLAGGTSKFAVIPQAYLSLDNPASLGFIKGDDFYAYLAYGSTDLTGSAFPNFQYNAVALGKLYGGMEYAAREIDTRTFLGYRLPLGSSFGIGVQGSFSRVETNVVSETTGGTGAWDGLSLFGGEITLGWAPTDWLAVGLGGSVGSYGGNVSDATGKIMSENSVDWAADMFYAGEVGLVLKMLEGSLTYSLDVAMSTYAEYVLDKSTMRLYKQTGIPLMIDTSLTWGFNGMNDFLVLKYMMSATAGGGSNNRNNAPFAQLMPGYEHWFGKFLSVRAAGVASMGLSNNPYYGFGGTLGATVVLDAWEIDLQGTYRYQPAKIIQDTLLPETIFSVGIHKKDTFARR